VLFREWQVDDVDARMIARFRRDCRAVIGSTIPLTHRLSWKRAGSTGAGASW
jgi:hypothetical protein